MHVMLWEFDSLLHWQALQERSGGQPKDATIMSIINSDIFEIAHSFFLPLDIVLLKCSAVTWWWCTICPCPCLIMLLLTTSDSCSMCHVGAAVCGTWTYPSNRSYQWKHLKVQSLYFFYLLFYGSKLRQNTIILKTMTLMVFHITATVFDRFLLSWLVQEPSLLTMCHGWISALPLHF